ncbi:MAG: nitronate monooxygenase [SAR324 cluster bacterium]|nr:nitronate monooxygenase [SAR324 cluster bacterium]
MKEKVDDFRWTLANKELVPIMIGGMGVDISTSELALEAARLGGIGHISDAMVPTVTDRHYKTKYSKDKQDKYKDNKLNFDKSKIKFDITELKKATRTYIEGVVSKKKGPGKLFINCMEKLQMNAPRETLKARLEAAMDSGIEGITLSAGLHLSSLELISDNPRFRDVLFGIIVSSVRALKIFLARAKRVARLPDFIIVEGPLAGGHLGFGLDWQEYNLKTIFKDVLKFVKEKGLNTPVIPAGGVFTGTDAVDFLKIGASAVQVATRFTVTKECGLSDAAKQHYFKANERDISVSMLSPTGYPMRVLLNSPGLTKYVRPNCEAYGFLLDKAGRCSYIDAYEKAEKIAKENNTPIIVEGKVCLCTHMRNYRIWTCGHYTYRLKDTSHLLSDGNYQMLDAKHVFQDYQFSTNHKIALPAIIKESDSKSDQVLARVV